MSGGQMYTKDEMLALWEDTGNMVPHVLRQYETISSVTALRPVNFLGPKERRVFVKGGSGKNQRAASKYKNGAGQPASAAVDASPLASDTVIGEKPEVGADAGVFGVAISPLSANASPLPTQHPVISVTHSNALPGHAASFSQHSPAVALQAAPPVVMNLNDDPAIVASAPLNFRSPPPGLGGVGGDTLWEYKDPHGQIQGPWTSSQMLNWFSGGYFPSDLMLRRLHWQGYAKLMTLLQASPHTPFSPHFAADRDYGVSEVPVPTVTSAPPSRDSSQHSLFGSFGNLSGSFGGVGSGSSAAATNVAAPVMDTEWRSSSDPAAAISMGGLSVGGPSSASIPVVSKVGGVSPQESLYRHVQESLASSPPVGASVATDASFLWGGMPAAANVASVGEGDKNATKPTTAVATNPSAPKVVADTPDAPVVVTQQEKVVEPKQQETNTGKRNQTRGRKKKGNRGKRQQQHQQQHNVQPKQAASLADVMAEEELASKGRRKLKEAEEKRLREEKKKHQAAKQVIWSGKEKKTLTLKQIMAAEAEESRIAREKQRAHEEANPPVQATGSWGLWGNAPATPQKSLKEIQRDEARAKQKATSQEKKHQNAAPTRGVGGDVKNDANLFWGAEGATVDKSTSSPASGPKAADFPALSSPSKGAVSPGNKGGKRRGHRK